ncbi:MAG: class I SAM-dependent methyltransferase [Tissierellia bacterium]|nr:class I SAM-dependent methyltransferase [Tissierellia bacterium]
MDRLETIVSLVRPGDTVADIGCDHGIVGLKLLQEGTIKKLIATDISLPCLDKANLLIKKHGFSEQYEGRVGDGLEPLEIGEVDSAIIAGMGGELMYRILTERPEMTQSIESFILQPMTEPDLIRKFAHQWGYSIVKDILVREGDKFYFVLQLVKAKGEIHVDEYEYPLTLMKNVPLFKEYMTMRIGQTQELIYQLDGVDSDKAKKRKNELKREIKRMEDVLCNYEKLLKN